jgi:hypothetical protein
MPGSRRFPPPWSIEDIGAVAPADLFGRGSLLSRKALRVQRSYTSRIAHRLSVFRRL